MTIRRLVLASRIHWDAFHRNPHQWLAGLWWLIRGKRLRARSRLEPLVGGSPRAYAYWIDRREQGRRDVLPDQPVPVGAVVDPGPESAGLVQTLGSLAGAGFARVAVVGGDRAAVADLAIDWLADLTELDRWLGEHRLAWVCTVRAGDLVAPGAGADYAAAAATTDAAVIYADDDLLSPAGARCYPHFKPRWNAELFRHHDFISGACAFRWPLRAAAGCTLDDALALALDDGQAPPEHLPRVLHHRRIRPLPQVRPGPPTVRGQPRVSVIIPTRDHPELLRTCLAGLSATRWGQLETIVVDNGSTDPEALALIRGHAAGGGRVIERPGPFNYSRLNNAAAQLATGDFLCLLNNDIEMVDGDWLSWLVAAAQRPEVGAAGARLLYPDRTIQHAGVVIGVGGGAAHAHRDVAEGEGGYFHRHNLPQYVSAVTAACLVVERGKFAAVGGLDEENFPVAFNDVDLCLKLNARGWQSFYEPRAVLVHHESRSRGDDREQRNRVRFAGELAALKRIWNTDAMIDPFHHPLLSRYSDQFVLAL